MSGRELTVLGALLWLIVIPGAASPAVSTTGATPPARIELCVQCHGSDGRSRTPAAPHIGGQNEVYLVWALNQYREGRREGDLMNEVITRLTRADIEALAHWYARQRWPALPDAGDEP
jgi:cytochrome c553